MYYLLFIVLFKSFLQLFKENDEETKRYNWI